MKEKKIIIDGVNVAGCEYYKGKCIGYTHYCKIGCKECTDIGIKLCHYKQTEIFKAKIERLEQENEELKNRLQILDDEILTVEITVEEFENYKKYKHVLEEIKKLTVIGINASQCNCGLRALADDILQIISEVKNERN